MFASLICESYTYAMIERDDFLRARIENTLEERDARLTRIATDSGSIAVRQALKDGIVIGSLASSKGAYKRGEVGHFIETPGDHGIARQLWLPAPRWIDPYRMARQREIIVTHAEPSQRFDAWQGAQSLIGDTEDYSKYEGEAQALFEEAGMALQFADANNDTLDIQIDRM